MSSEWELDEGIKSIKSAWRREHTARANLEKMLEQAEAENAKLQELFNETLIRLVAASEAAGGGFMDARYCELLESHGIEVIE